MRSNPKISVVMTVFNGERFIKEAIDSILSQTFKDFEFIIVDNASTDKTTDIIASYDDSRIVCINNEENLGQTKALNIGIKSSRSEYIARMDADDISYPERLELQYDFMRKNSSIAVLGSWYLEIDEYGNAIRKFRLPTNPIEIKCYLLGSSELSYHCVPHPIVLMRREAIFDVGLYDEKYIAQDFDLWVKLSRKYLISNLPKILFKYRLYKGMQSSRLSNEFQKDCQDIIVKNIKHFCPNLNEKEKSSLMRMLKFLPQEAQEDGERVIETFDNFFYQATAGYNNTISNIKDKLKLYYMPRLFRTNRTLSLKTALNLIKSNPSFLKDKKLYSKICKSILVSN